MATHAEGRIAFLKAELGITDAQKTVWDAYAAALTKNLQDMQAMRVTMKKVMEAKSPVERLDAHLTAMDGRVASLKEVKPTLAALYAALSDDQKKKADQILTGMGCMM
jgi:LTXXQ motif family protein